MKTLELIKLLKQKEGEKIEFKENITDFNKVVCAFLNTEGGYVLLGVTDEGEIKGIKKDIVQKISDSLQAIIPYPKIKIKKIKIDKRNVIVIEVEKSKDKLYSVGNVVYIRIGANNRPLSTNEVIEKASESLRIIFDELICKEAKIKDLDKKKITFYFKQREKIRGIKTRNDLKENIFRLKIVKKENGKILPTNAGILFFGKDPQKFIPHAKVSLINFKDEEMKEYKDRKEFSGTILEIIEEIENYFLKNFKIIGGFQIGFKRGEFLEYPIEAIREALINALIHRNYFDFSEIRIFIFPDKISIKNPGSFPSGVTPENPEHKPRNPILSQYLYDLGYIEKYGIGIIRMKEICKNHPLVNLKFKIKPFFSEVIFEKEKKFEIDKVNEKILILLKQGEKRSSEIAKFIGFSRQTTVKKLDYLVSLSLIKKKGKGAGVKYFV